MIKNISIKTINKAIFKYRHWLLIAGAVLVILLGWLATGSVRVYRSAKELQQECYLAGQHFLNQDFVLASQGLTDCQAKTLTTRQELNKLRLASLGLLNDLIGSLDKSLIALANLAEDGKSIAKLAEEWTGLAPTDQNIFKFTLIKFPEITQLNQRVQSHQEELVRALDGNLVTRYFLKKKLAEPLALASQVTSLVSRLQSYAEVLAWAMAYDQPKTFLVFFQNSSELRPTGGFWGSYGILKIDQGKIVSLVTDDIYHLDVNLIGQATPAAPSAIAKYLKTPQWFLRDANWSPHFPEAAELGQSMYQLAGGPEKIDGVIAITPQLIEDLLAYLGPIDLAGQQFTRENFLEQLQYEVELGYQQKNISSWNRKDIVQSLADKFLEKLPQSLANLQDFENLIGLVDANLQDKNIILFANNPAVQAKIISHNWGGAINPSSGDYLAVIDANLASFKTDLFIERDISYSIGLEEINRQQSGLVATVKIHYAHHGDFDWKTTRYRTYTRVYAPAGSKLLKAEGVMEDDRSSNPGPVEVTTEYGKTVFGGFIAIEPQTGASLTFKYQLPDRVADQLKAGQYHLLLQKQPGVRNQTIQLEINHSQPAKKVYWLNNDYLDLDDKLIINATPLIKDSDLLIKY